MRSGSSTTSPSIIDDTISPAGAEFANALRDFEHQLDAALAAGSRVSAAAVRARLAHRVSAVVGHSFFAEIDQATSAVVKARGHTVKGHRVAEQVARRIGVPDTLLYGDEQKDPGDKRRG